MGFNSAFKGLTPQRRSGSSYRSNLKRSLGFFFYPLKMRAKTSVSNYHYMLPNYHYMLPNYHYMLPNYHYMLPNFP